jgi:hypothetical protein
MATAVNHQPPILDARQGKGPQVVNPTTAQKQIIPIKVGIFGGQGSGKTTSAAMLALGLSIELHNRAPVWVTDTEPGWQFMKPLFAAEKVELVQRTVPTFKAMLGDIRDAQRGGACVWAGDSLTIIWQELMQSFKAKNGGRIPINVWGDIKALWGQYTSSFLNSPMHCFALGRLGNVMEEIQDDESKTGGTKLVKTGTTFKAGGSESFGYEPHLLLELSLERKAKRKAGSTLEGEGRMVHRVDVLKDRTWALNGKVIRWSDKAAYKPGGYRDVWTSIKPHFDLVQQTMGFVTLDTTQDSSDMIDSNGNSEFYKNRERRNHCAGEITELLDHLFGGTGKEDKHIRREVTRSIFNVLSKEAAADMSLEKVERGLRILQAFERRIKREKAGDPPNDILAKGELEILAQLDIDIREFDEGTAEESELPF